MKPFRKLRKFSILLLVLPLLSCTIEDIFDSSGGGSSGTSEDTIIDGLKQALNIGIKTAADSVSQLNGYFANEAIKLALPSDVKEIVDYTKTVETALSSSDEGKVLLRLIPEINALLKIESNLVFALNRAAESAAPHSIPIFKEAITSLTISDGMSILQGDSNAATTYLKGQTYQPLVKTYGPMIDTSLQEVKAVEIWSSFTGYYNSIVDFYNGNFQTENSITKALYIGVLASISPTLGKPPTLTTSLGAYTTEKALDGLFKMVGQQEYLIRKDPLQRVTDVLKEVFGLQDDK